MLKDSIPQDRSAESSQLFLLAARRGCAMDIHVQFSSPPLGKGDIGSRLGGLSGSSSDEKLGHRVIWRSHCLISCRAGSVQLCCSRVW